MENILLSLVGIMLISFTLPIIIVTINQIVYANSKTKFIFWFYISISIRLFMLFIVLVIGYNLI